MITTTMTAQELLREYKADYENYLRPKISSLASRKTHDLKLCKGRWVPVKEEIKAKTPTGNIYGLRCKLRWNKRRGAGWSIITYTITSDSKSGKKVAYIFSDSIPIMLSSSFLREIKTSVSDFLIPGATWDIMTGDDDSQRYSAYINFGDSIGAGVGGWESGVFVLRHLIKGWKTDPVKEFLETRNQEEPKEEENLTKKSEIDLAWEAYFSGNLETV